MSDLAAGRLRWREAAAHAGCCESTWWRTHPEPDGRDRNGGWWTVETVDHWTDSRPRSRGGGTPRLEVDRAVRRFRRGEQRAVIAADLGVSVRTVSRWCAAVDK